MANEINNTNRCQKIAQNLHCVLTMMISRTTYVGLLKSWSTLDLSADFIGGKDILVGDRRSPIAFDLDLDVCGKSLLLLNE